MYTRPAIVISCETHSCINYLINYMHADGIPIPECINFSNELLPSLLYFSKREAGRILKLGDARGVCLCMTVNTMRDFIPTRECASLYRIIFDDMEVEHIATQLIDEPDMPTIQAAHCDEFPRAWDITYHRGYNKVLDILKRHKLTRGKYKLALHDKQSALNDYPHRTDNKDFIQEGLAMLHVTMINRRTATQADFNLTKDEKLALLKVHNARISGILNAIEYIKVTQRPH